jgi:hypothetical protein
MPQKRKPSFTREQLDQFMSGSTGAEAMGHTKSPNAGKQGFMAQEVEKLLRKNPEIFEEMLDEETQKFFAGGDVRYNSSRGKTF